MKIWVLIFLLVLGAVMVESFKGIRRPKPQRAHADEDKASESALGEENSSNKESKAVSSETAIENSADDSQEGSNRVRRQTSSRKWRSRGGCNGRMNKNWRKNLGKDQGWKGRGYAGDKNRRQGPKMTKITIETVEVIKLRPSYRDKSDDDFKSAEECGPPYDERKTIRTTSAPDQPTTTAASAIDETTSTTAANSDDVTSSEQPSRIRRMTKESKPKKIPSRSSQSTVKARPKVVQTETIDASIYSLTQAMTEKPRTLVN